MSRAQLRKGLLTAAFTATFLAGVLVGEARDSITEKTTVIRTGTVTWGTPVPLQPWMDPDSVCKKLEEEINE